jgi:hypothetical protein
MKFQIFRLWIHRCHVGDRLYGCARWVFYFFIVTWFSCSSELSYDDILTLAIPSKEEDCILGKKVGVFLVCVNSAQSSADVQSCTIEQRKTFNVWLISHETCTGFVQHYQRVKGQEMATYSFRMIVRSKGFKMVLSWQALLMVPWKGWRISPHFTPRKSRKPLVIPFSPIARKLQMKMPEWLLSNSKFIE